MTAVRLGKIGYRNVLPIYHPLETGLIENDFAIVSGPPSRLNRLMATGQLDISAASSIEYARNPERYLLIPDMAIGSRGPVQSVLLLSRGAVRDLSGQTILVSSQTHTSAALLRILLTELWRIRADLVTGEATQLLGQGRRPEAILAIGDEALTLRDHPDYPQRTDLGEAWRSLTGLPFIFGVWIAQRQAATRADTAIRRAAATLRAAKEWGKDHLEAMSRLAAGDGDQARMRSYFNGLVYDLRERETQGLVRFYERLAAHRLIDAPPALRFLGD